MDRRILNMRKKQKTFVNGKLVDYENHNCDEDYENYWATGGNGSADNYEGD